MDSSFDRRHNHVQYFTRLMWVLRISASFETQLNCLWISKVLQSIENPEQRRGSFSIKKGRAVFNDKAGGSDHSTFWDLGL